VTENKVRENFAQRYKTSFKEKKKNYPDACPKNGALPTMAAISTLKC